jgi:hypothetical protein
LGSNSTECVVAARMAAQRLHLWKKKPKGDPQRRLFWAEREPQFYVVHTRLEALNFGRGRKATMDAVVIWLKARSFDFGSSEKWCHRQGLWQPESLCCAVSCWQMRILSFQTRARTVGQPRECTSVELGVHSICERCVGLAFR